MISVLDIFKLYLPYKYIILGMFICTLANKVISYYVIDLNGELTDKMIDSLGSMDFDKSWDNVINVLLKILIYGVATWLISMIDFLIGYVSQIKAIRRIRIMLYDKILSNDLRFFDNNSSGDLVARFEEVESSAGCMTFPEELIIPIIDIIYGLIRIIDYDWKLILTSFAELPVMMFLILFFGVWNAKQTIKLRNMWGNINGKFVEGIEKYDFIRSVLSIETEKDRLLNHMKKHDKKAIKVGYCNFLFAGSIGKLLDTGLNIATWYIILKNIVNLDMTFGDVTIFQQYVELVQIGVYSLSGLYTKIMEMKGHCNLFMNILKEDYFDEKYDDMKSNPNEHAKMNKNEKVISIKNLSISFHLNENEESKLNVLKNINLDVNSHGRYAIVGDSGSGKSTLIDILQYKHKVFFGEVNINGKDIRRMSINEIYSYISLVSQNEQYISHLSVMENLLYSLDIEISEEEIKSMTEKLNLDLDLNGDMNLSGGEMRRFSLLRCLLRKTPIVILDEPLTGLDGESITNVRSFLDDYLDENEITLIVITHNIKYASTFDNIFVIENGKITQSGNHNRLVSDINGWYYKNYCN